MSHRKRPIPLLLVEMPFHVRVWIEFFPHSIVIISVTEDTLWYLKIITLLESPKVSSLICLNFIQPLILTRCFIQICLVVLTLKCDISLWTNCLLSFSWFSSPILCMVMKTIFNVICRTLPKFTQVNLFPQFTFNLRCDWCYEKCFSEAWLKYVEIFIHLLLNLFVLFRQQKWKWETLKSHTAKTTCSSSQPFRSHFELLTTIFGFNLDPFKRNNLGGQKISRNRGVLSPWGTPPAVLVLFCIFFLAIFFWWMLGLPRQLASFCSFPFVRSALVDLTPFNKLCFHGFRCHLHAENTLISSLHLMDTFICTPVRKLSLFSSNSICL